MIRGICKSNIDDYNKVVWPTKFVSVPRKGDLIAGLNTVQAKVHSITHCIATDRGTLFQPISVDSGQPYIVIELGRI